jgi:hypothetical protein
MCPLCIGTATLVVSGTTSAGGLAALVLRHLRRKRPGLGHRGPRKISCLGGRG